MRDRHDPRQTPDRLPGLMVTVVVDVLAAITAA